MVNGFWAKQTDRLRSMREVSRLCSATACSILLSLSADSLVQAQEFQAQETSRRSDSAVDKTAKTIPANESTAADDPVYRVALQSAAINESSGLAASHRRANRFWTHNDSGGQPRVFAVDSQGRVTGVWKLPSAQAVDWEDMASFTLDGRARLIVADVGDNDAKRSEVQLYLFDEPDPDQTGVVKRVQTLRVRLPGGACDCEAVAVDPISKEIWLATKHRLPICKLLVVPLGGADSKPVIEARHVATLFIPMVTAMDISKDSSRLVLANYFDAFVYRNTAEASAWQAVLQSKPQHYVLPSLKQIEAIAFDAELRLWVTSEGRPGYLARLGPAVEAGSQVAAPFEPPLPSEKKLDVRN